MQTILEQLQERTPALRRPETSNPTVYTPTVKEIPYDYVAKFLLKGERGNRIPHVINISNEGAFVAVEIAYSFMPARLQPLTQNEANETKATIRAFAKQVIDPGAASKYSVNDVVDDPRQILQCLLARFCGINFLYSITDSGSGRELQNLPIHSIAGLGESTGERPFRPLPKPMIFMPRSTIRIEVEEISEGPLYKGADLYIVFHGYKMLGYGTG